MIEVSLFEVTRTRPTVFVLSGTGTVGGVPVSVVVLTWLCRTDHKNKAWIMSGDMLNKNTIDDNTHVCWKAQHYSIGPWTRELLHCYDEHEWDVFSHTVPAREWIPNKSIVPPCLSDMSSTQGNTVSHRQDSVLSFAPGIDCFQWYWSRSRSFRQLVPPGKRRTAHRLRNSP